MAKYAAVHMVFNHLDQIAPHLRPQADRVCHDVANGVKNYARLSMETPKHGREYRRGKKIHVASAPGEPPAIDMGYLANSIQTKRIQPLLWHVTVGAAYGYILEFGSRKMAARPFMRPAAKAYFPTFVERIKALRFAP